MNIEDRPLDSIRPYVDNPRVISMAAVAAVAASIERFGFRQPIVVDGDGVIIIGHTRRLAAMRLGLKTVPVHVADGLPERDITALRLMDNRSGEFSNWSPDGLRSEIEALKATSEDLLIWFDDEYLVVPDPDGFEDAMDVLRQEQQQENILDIVDSQKMTSVRVGEVRWMMSLKAVEDQVNKWSRETDGSKRALRRKLLTQLGII